jgi:hypothetical protein
MTDKVQQFMRVIVSGIGFNKECNPGVKSSFISLNGVRIRKFDRMVCQDGLPGCCPKWTQVRSKVCMETHLLTNNNDY